MQPSRRSFLGLSSATAITLLAGCSASGAGNTPTQETTTASTTTDSSSYEVRVEGPETDQLLFDKSDITSVGVVQENRTGGFIFSVTLSDQSTEDVTNTFQTVGVADNPEQFEVVHYHNGTEVSRLGISPGLAQNIANGDWNGEFLMSFEKRGKAAEIRDLLAESTS